MLRAAVTLAGRNRTTSSPGTALRLPDLPTARRCPWIAGKRPALGGFLSGVESLGEERADVRIGNRCHATTLVNGRAVHLTAGRLVGERERIRHAELPGHPRHQVRRVRDGHPGRGDIQGPGRPPAADPGGMRRGPERRLRHADDRDAELGVNMRAKPWPTAGIQVNIAIDHDQRELASWRAGQPAGGPPAAAEARAGRTPQADTCLLYTSDAADD